MPQALPSDAVRLIDTFFPSSVEGRSRNQTLVNYTNAPVISGLILLIEQLPEGTLQLSAQEYSHLVWAIGSLKHVAARIEVGNNSAGGGWPIPSFENEDAIALLRRLLSKCPDEGIRPSTSELEFIQDEELRTLLRRDISSSEAALDNGQWKGATVLAGAALEALLLWRVAQHSDAERQSAVKRADRKVNPARPEDWHLPDYIEVARDLGDIADGTATQGRLAKDFRNLIHPGREIRKQMRCDRGTAHAAFAALSLVIADFEKIRSR